MRIRSFLALATTVGLLVVGSATPVSAAEAEASSTTEGVGLFTVVKGQSIRVADNYLESTNLDLHGSAASGDVTPYLINWDQWFGCFSLNNANDVFANYMFWWDGVGRDVRLKCGEGSAASGWGYKHIRDGKESQWQAKLNAAKAAGWNAAAVGVESWDDLMSGATGSVILYPDYIRRDTVGNKWCANNEFYLQDLKSGRVLYSFRVETAWASDSDRLITSFPSGRTYC